MNCWHVAREVCLKHPVRNLFLRHASIIPWSSLNAARHLETITSVTRAAYAGCPLNAITPQLRGKVLETVARGVYQWSRPDSIIEDPIPGQRCNGTKRGLNSAEYDFLCDGRRVQCKSAQLCWHESERRWRVQFQKIKPNLHDDLLLVLYSPSGLHVLTYTVPVSVQGPRGSCSAKTLSFIFGGQSLIGLRDWRDSEDVVLKKILQSGSGHRLASLQMTDEEVVNALERHNFSVSLSLQSDVYKNHPLNNMTPTARGLLVQHMVQEVDLLCNPGFAHAFATTYKSPCDWQRDGLRLECKHTRLSWHQNCWMCTFQRVDTSKFDMLYLAVDTPHALHILKFGGSQWLYTIGLSDRRTVVKVKAPTKVICPLVAADAIIDKFVSTGSQHVASVVWKCGVNQDFA